MPLKKNASGTVFLIDELDKRKEEQAIFTQVPVRGERGMFEINTKEKQEALNYATLMNALNFTEHKLEPLFEEFAKHIEVNLPIFNPNVCEEYANFFNVESSTLIREYNNAKKAFSLLRRTDEIIKRGSQDYPSLFAQTDQAPRFLYIRGKNPCFMKKEPLP